MVWYDPTGGSVCEPSPHERDEVTRQSVWKGPTASLLSLLKDSPWEGSSRNGLCHEVTREERRLEECPGPPKSTQPSLPV